MQYMTRSAPLSEEEKLRRDEERQRADAERRLKNNRLGIAIFQASWILAFVCLILVYYWTASAPGWRPTASEIPNLILPSVATLLLLVSGGLARQALKVVESTPAGSPPRFLNLWRGALVLGAIFCVLMLIQFFMIPASDAGQQYGFVYRLMIGYHAIHAIIIGGMMVQVLRYGADGRYHQGHSWSVEGAAKLWYFVVGAWLLFYAVLYLPYLMGQSPA